MTAAREGLAQFLAGRALLTESVSTAARAAALSHATPEAHYARGVLLERHGSAGAVKEFEAAVAARPQDYALWLELGRARDQSGNAAGALAALIEAANSAPFYAQPRWQLGNALFRDRRILEALVELRLAAHSNPKLASPSLALMWSALNGDVDDVEKAFAARTPAMQTALARFLVKRGKVTEAMRYFHAAGGISPEERSGMISDLLAAKDFEAAFEVWSASRPTKGLGAGHVENGGFEEAIALDEKSFGWQVVQNVQGIQVALDPAAHPNGGQSLRIDWTGHPDTLTPIVSQLILVEPATKYRLGFAQRGTDLVMLGLPVVSVLDARDALGNSGDYRQAAIARSPTLPKGSSEWQQYSFEFITGASTRAVLIRIHRENCDVHPCPAFGHAWFDDFTLSK